MFLQTPEVNICIRCKITFKYHNVKHRALHRFWCHCCFFNLKTEAQNSVFTFHILFFNRILLLQFIYVSGTQKLLVCYSYKNLMTFGGCKQDFMLVMGQNVGTNASKDKPTEKHLFAMDPSKVSERARGRQSRRPSRVCILKMDGTFVVVVKVKTVSHCCLSFHSFYLSMCQYMLQNNRTS